MNMGSEWRLFIGETESAAKASALVEALEPYARRLEDQGLPVIINFDHLAKWLGIPASDLRSVAKDGKAHYTTHFVPKNNGQTRRIDQPSTFLKRAQRRLLRGLLTRIPVHSAANAFAIGKSIRINASPHRARPMVLSLDVKDFFNSIRPALIAAAFLDLGYNPSVCEALLALVVYRNGLAQGAPTSPAMSNIVLRTFDVDLENTMHMVGGSYTRYADDITVSGRFKPGLTIFLCREMLSRYGRQLNDSKTRLMYRHQRQVVTGVTVNERLQASRELRRYLRQQLFYLQRYGDSARMSDAKQVDAHRRRLRGLVEFVLFLNREDRDASQLRALLGSWGSVAEVEDTPQNVG